MGERAKRLHPGPGGRGAIELGAAADHHGPALLPQPPLVPAEQRRLAPPASPVTRTTPPPRRASRATCSRARSSSSRPTNGSSSGRTTPTGSPTPPSGTPPSDADAQLPRVDEGRLPPVPWLPAPRSSPVPPRAGTRCAPSSTALSNSARALPKPRPSSSANTPAARRSSATASARRPLAHSPRASSRQPSSRSGCSRTSASARRHRLPRGSRGEGRGDRHLPCRQVQFIQPGGLGRRPPLVRALAVRRSVPPPERLLEQAPGLCPGAVRARRTAASNRQASTASSGSRSAYPGGALTRTPAGVRGGLPGSSARRRLDT